jgi:molybdopterin molybdotransferase
MNDLPPSPIAARDAQLTVDEARAAIAGALRPVSGEDLVPLAEAAGRVLARDLHSPIDVPAHDNSAMDGFAFDGAALNAGGTLTLRCVGERLAGAVPADAAALAGGQCLRIMTGAVMPAGADTVIPLELARAERDQVQFSADGLRIGDHRRRRGEDLAAGGVALAGGRRLTPADIGLSASLGLTALAARRRLRVAIFSTGDEVLPAGSVLAPGCLYDSNRPALAAALAQLPVEVLDLGLVRDDPDALAATLRQAADSADAVITSGGVSAGDADHTRSVLAALGEVAFWKVAMRPGRPFAFGPLQAPQGTSWLFALPGNPVAALVSYLVFVRDALLQLAGAAPATPPRLRVPCTQALRKRPGRTEFQRGTVEPDGRGGFQVRPFAEQGAGILRSMSVANALIVLGHAQGSVAAGEPVDVLLFQGLF